MLFILLARLSMLSILYHHESADDNMRVVILMVS